jgi:hypothetical protein
MGGDVVGDAPQSKYPRNRYWVFEVTVIAALPVPFAAAVIRSGDVGAHGTLSSGHAVTPAVPAGNGFPLESTTSTVRMIVPPFAAPAGAAATTDPPSATRHIATIPRNVETRRVLVSN